MYARVQAKSRAWRVFILLVCTATALCAKATENNSRSPLGFVSCSTKAGTLPTYEDACLGKRSGEIACGEHVEILAREGAFFRIRTKTGDTYIGAASVSGSPKKFVPVVVEGPTSQPDCAAAWASERAKTPGKQSPRALFAPNPEYTEEAKRAKLEGTVVMSLTVGNDGHPYDIHVEKSLGMGLDEQAVATLSKWRFDPAREDGKPVPAHITVEMKFSRY